MASTRIVTIVLAALLLSAPAVAQAPALPATPLDSVLAVVGGQGITGKELWWAMEQGWGGQILDEMITDLLIRKAAREVLPRL